MEPGVQVTGTLVSQLSVAVTLAQVGGVGLQPRGPPGGTPTSTGGVLSLTFTVFSQGLEQLLASVTVSPSVYEPQVEPACTVTHCAVGSPMMVAPVAVHE